MSHHTPAGRLVPPVTERDHQQGNPAAPVTLLEYGDFECPYSRRARHSVEELQQRLGDRLRFVFRAFPLTEIHPHAEHAAEAAEAAGAQGRYWQLYEILFKNNHALEDANLARYAAEAGLDLRAFETAMALHTYAPRVQESAQSGLESGVGGTPTFFINGVRHDGDYDVETLLAATERSARTLHAGDDRHEREAASTAGPHIDVTNDEASQQYQARIDGNLCLIQYERQDTRIIYLHTEVPPALEGRGIASALARAALDDAQARKLTVVPLCPFVSAYIRRHPEYLPLVDPSYRARLGPARR